ncbi:fasciclin domain-containing protein [Pelagicoccus mobilis]|uniref:Fasciclin domain-containing protein n=1 Tax=Pelagicoccus mobilis TaxID=415221 RepID=A0A934VNA0_9BACT|nr:fasciclin domain-containing protein [Pelagicoccus mobilis]MBK1879711.1 fasciclin domain-containing protein [Pelagicoccus mobilis]
MKHTTLRTLSLLFLGITAFILTATANASQRSLTIFKAENDDGSTYYRNGTVTLSVSMDQGESFKTIKRVYLRRGLGISSTSFLSHLPSDSLVKVDARLGKFRGDRPEQYTFVDNPDDVKDELEKLFKFFRTEVNQFNIPVQFRADQTIAQVASGDPQFSTLVAALGAADLVGTVNGEGSFTVFAPTNAAFEKLGQDTINFLLDPANKATLTDILLYHVIVGNELQSGSVLERATLKMAQGGLVAVDPGAGTINSSELILTNILTSNGVIHVIDTVLNPADSVTPTQNIAEVATSAGVFTTLLQAVGDTGIGGALVDTNNPVTVFAPSDEAFAKLPAGLLDSLTVDQIRNILLYHVVPGEVRSEDLFGLDEADPLLGQPIQVNGELERINKSDFDLLDIVTTSGNIHIIDEVLIPPSF